MKFFLPLLFILPAVCNSQSYYKEGEVVADLPILKILNHPDSVSSLKKNHAKIIILDFFGTWCVPCIKAIPKLESYKTRFKEEISILLVSTENESKLAGFISKRKPFAFPIIADEDQLFTHAFGPPSYPYTLVMDENLKIVLITHVADLTEPLLEKFIHARKDTVKTSLPEPEIITNNKTDNPMPPFIASNNELIRLSQDFMYAAKTGEDASTFISRLKDLPLMDLVTNLNNDDDKKAFWINLYNAYTNAALHKDPGLYKNRNAFFRNKNIIIAGERFSLDKIEHGLLRRSKIKWSLGYLGKLFPGNTERKLRVNDLDYRIHFALNCGAKSCPPIAFYKPEQLNKQLDLATMAYLSGEAVYDPKNNILHLPAILSWFRRDFGGTKKIIRLLKERQLLQNTINPKIKFKKYDWSLYLDNYKL